jgi:Flp pilus assembly protein TadG
MGRWLGAFCRDERGSVVALEFAFVATVLVLGAVTGLVAARQAALAYEDEPAATRTR